MEKNTSDHASSHYNHTVRTDFSLGKYINAPSEECCKRGEKIVFSTIIENIKSFFHSEEELTAQPKQVPEAASELYGKNTPVVTQKIIEKPLPTPTLPFSPDELRAALKPEPKQEPRLAPRDITHEIDAFESTLRDVHETVTPRTRDPPTKITSPGTQQTLNDSFFNEFEEFMNREDLEADGILEKDILWRMKEFHRHRQEGKEFYLYSKDMQGAVQRKLGELKTLEHEWFNKRANADQLEKDLQIIESEIEARTADLKQLLKQAKAKSRLERNVPEGQEFILLDGRKLHNLLELKLALHTMPDQMFSQHVTSIKNDFASWIRGTMNEQELANDLGALRDRTQLEMFLGKIN